MDSQTANAALSPIRNLAEFYEKKLNKIQSHSIGENLPRSRSPQRGHQVPNKTYVDIDRMTVLDFEKLEQNPPSINPRRKHLKVINNKAMTTFGNEAFNLKLYGEASELRTKKVSI